LGETKLTSGYKRNIVRALIKREILTLLNDRRLVRTESFGHLGYGHHFCLRELENIDQAIIELLGEAYTVPQQEWLRRANRALRGRSDNWQFFRH
jgi:hypothetical protein